METVGSGVGSGVETLLAEVEVGTGLALPARTLEGVLATAVTGHLGVNLLLCPCICTPLYVHLLFQQFLRSHQHSLRVFQLSLSLVSFLHPSYRLRFLQFSF